MIVPGCRANREERRRPLAGDELIPEPMAVITHAITIAVTPAAIWPWLVQLGSGRAGWYAYDRIDNGGTPSARRIIPALQHVAVGDVMPWLPGATEGFIVRQIIPERALVLIEPRAPGRVPVPDTPGGVGPAPLVSWGLILEPLAGERTRLIARGRIARDWLSGVSTAATPGTRTFIEHIYGVLARLPRPLLLSVAGAGHYLMESRMLRGIKRRAEGHAGAGPTVPRAAPTPQRR